MYQYPHRYPRHFQDVLKSFEMDRQRILIEHDMLKDLIETKRNTA